MNLLLENYCKLQKFNLLPDLDKMKQSLDCAEIVIHVVFCCLDRLQNFNYCTDIQISTADE